MSEKSSLAKSFDNAQSQLVTQTADLPLGTLADMVESGAIDLKPGFQRRERWSVEDQSALVESFLLNVPVPPIYLAENENGTYSAIDGKQRLRAIADFMNNRFKLSDLDRLKDAEGKQFKQLPTEITNALRLRPFLRVVTLLKQTNEILKFEVFLRLNRGGEELNDQEIRNVAFRGNLNTEIYESSSNKFLRKKLKITNDKSSAYRQMTDAEFVLRFLALHDGIDTFKGKLAREMDQFMIKNKKTNEKEAKKIISVFDKAISRCEALWGDFAFRRPDGNAWRDQTLAGMYDAQMIAAAQVSSGTYDRAKKNRNAIVRATRKLFQDPEFAKSVQTGTNTPARIKYRVNKMKEMLEGI